MKKPITHKKSKRKLLSLSNFLILFSLVILSVPFILAEAISDESSTSLNIGTTGIHCSDDGREWIDYRTFPWSTSPSTSYGQCYNSDPEVIGSRFCCPKYYECNFLGTPGVYGCEYTNKDFCFKLETMEECNNYTAWVGINNIETALNKEEGYCGPHDNSWWDGEGAYAGQICWNTVDCSCEWNETSSNCTAVDDLRIECNETINPLQAEGECIYTLLTWEDTCNIDGFIYASWGAIWEGDAIGGEETDCVDTGIRKIPCESMVKLIFFTLVNLIIVVLLIIIIYYLIQKKFFRKLFKKR